MLIKSKNHLVYFIRFIKYEIVLSGNNERSTPYFFVLFINYIYSMNIYIYNKYIVG